MWRAESQAENVLDVRVCWWRGAADLTEGKEQPRGTQRGWNDHWPMEVLRPSSGALQLHKPTSPQTDAEAWACSSERSPKIPQTWQWGGWPSATHGWAANPILYLEYHIASNGFWSQGKTVRDPCSLGNLEAEFMGRLKGLQHSYLHAPKKYFLCGHFWEVKSFNHLKTYMI